MRFDTGSRALYATDASNYRMPPLGVVLPRHVDELVIDVPAVRLAAVGLDLDQRGAGGRDAG